MGTMRSFEKGSMKFKLLMYVAAAVLLSGCGPLDSLIVHPLHVLHQQDEYNDRAKEAEAQAKLSWPTNPVPIDTGTGGQ